MEIENQFAVPGSAEAVWARLLQVEEIAGCMPGAELTETVDERTWKGRMNTKLGPVSLSFNGTVTMEERDDDGHVVVLNAQGTEQRGKGVARASVRSWLEPGDGETVVKVVTDIQLTGAVAQLSRGLLPAVSQGLTEDFASCLRQRMLARDSQAPAPVRSKPLSGFRLLLSALFRKLFRRGGRR